MQRCTRRQIMQAIVRATGSGIALLASCRPLGPAAQQGSGVPAPRAKLSFATWGDLTGALTDAYERQLKRFHQQYPTIEVEFFIAPFAEYRTQLFALLTAGQPYTLFVSGNYWTFELSGNDALLDLTNRVKRDLDTTKLSPVAVRSGTDYTGKIWGIARTANVAVLYYNKEHFDQAGLPYPNENWSYDDVLKAARQLSREELARYGWYSRNFISSDWVPLTHSWGGGFIDPKDWTRMTVNRPENVEALQWAVDTIHRHRVAPTVEVERELNQKYGTEGPFSGGHVAMMNGIDQVGFWGKGLVEALRFDVTYVPRGPKARKSAAPTHHYVIPRLVQPDAAEAAWRLLKFLLLDLEAHVDVAVGIRFMPMLKAAYDDLRIRKRPLPPDNMKAFIDPLVQGWADDIDVNGVWSKWTEIVGRELTLAWRGEKTVKAALDEAQPLCQQAADDFYKARR